MTEANRDRLLRKLAKMKAAQEGEAKLGNMEAAEAFAAAINRMLIDNELDMSDVDYKSQQDDDPVVQMMVNLDSYGIKRKKVRVDWQESLAHIVAKAHLCRFLVSPGSNRIFFVGTRSHAMVAEYVYGTLAPIADKMATKEKYKYGAECFKRDGHWRGVNGFREAWLSAFLHRIDERFEEMKRAAVAQTPNSSTALIRLSGALVKANQYMEQFKGRAPGLGGLRQRNAEGARRGRAAADSMALGRQGVTSGIRGRLEK